MHGLTVVGPRGAHEALLAGRVRVAMLAETGTSQDGSGTVRRPAALVGYALNAVWPLTSTTVRITRTCSLLAAPARPSRPPTMPPRAGPMFPTCQRRPWRVPRSSPPPG